MRKETVRPLRLEVVVLIIAGARIVGGIVSTTITISRNWFGASTKVIVDWRLPPAEAFSV